MYCRRVGRKGDGDKFLYAVIVSDLALAWDFWDEYICGILSTPFMCG
jgi:hypothetical protein